MLCVFAAAILPSMKAARDLYGGVTRRIAEFTDETVITMQPEIHKVIRLVGRIVRFKRLMVLLLLCLGLVLRDHVDVKRSPFVIATTLKATPARPTRSP